MDPDLDRVDTGGNPLSRASFHKISVKVKPSLPAGKEYVDSTQRVPVGGERRLDRQRIVQSNNACRNLGSLVGGAKTIRRRKEGVHEIARRNHVIDLEIALTNE